jgi:hypothetical protein
LKYTLTSIRGEKRTVKDPGTFQSAAAGLPGHPAALQNTGRRENRHHPLLFLYRKVFPEPKKFFLRVRELFPKPREVFPRVREIFQELLKLLPRARELPPATSAGTPGFDGRGL